MQHEIISDETIQDRGKVVAYLERVLDEALRATADTENADAERVHLWRIDASTDELSDKVIESGGSPREMSEKALTCFEEAGEHHVGVVLTAGNRRLSIKATHDGYRITISPLSPPPPEATSGSEGTISGATSVAQSVPTSPRPPGLSSGVPAGVLDQAGDLSSTQKSMPATGVSKEA